MSVSLAAGVTTLRTSSRSRTTTGCPTACSAAAASRARTVLPLPGGPLIQIAQLIVRDLRRARFTGRAGLHCSQGGQDRRTDIANAQDRRSGPVQPGFGDRAEDQSAGAAATVTRHHDQAGFLGFGSLDDGRRRRSVPDARPDSRDTAFPEPGSNSVEVALGFANSPRA